MLSITKSDVPEYLCAGLFYHSLEGDDCEVFEAPADVMKPNLTVNSKEDLQHLLSSLRYWMVVEPPIELVEHCLQLGFEGLPCMDDGPDLLYLPALRKIQLKENPEDQLKAAISAGNLPVLRCVVKIVADEGLVKLSAQHFGLALQANNVECIKYLVEQGCPHDVNGRYYCPNSVDCPDYNPSFNACIQKTENTVIVDCLLKHGYRWDRLTMRQYAFSDNCSLAIIRHLHERGCHEWEGAMASAAMRGRLDILQFAHEHGVPWDDSLTCMTARSSIDSSLACLQYAVTHGCPWADGTLIDAACSYRCDIFLYALEHGCPYDPHVATVVARRALCLLRYLLKRGYAVDADQCLRSVLCGFADADVLRCLRNQGGQWPDDAANLLVYRGDLTCLQYAANDGVLFDSPDLYKTASAHEQAYLDVVKFLRQCGCPWDHTAVSTAATYGIAAVLDWLLQNGCPVTPPNYPTDPQAYRQHPTHLAAKKRHREAVECLLRYNHAIPLTDAQLREITHAGCRALLSQHQLPSGRVESQLSEGGSALGKRRAEEESQ